jgi:hypothetical protein
MARLVAVATACVAVALVAQETSAEPYSTKKVHPKGLDGGTSGISTPFAVDMQGCDEGDGFAVVSPVGAVTGYSGRQGCSPIGTQFGKFECRANVADDGYELYFTEYFNKYCSAGTLSDKLPYNPEECEDRNGDKTNTTMLCQDISAVSAADDKVGSVLLLSSRYEKKDKCLANSDVLGEEDITYFPKDATPCQALTDTDAFFKTECPQTAGPVTKLYTSIQCNIEYAYADLKDVALIKAAYDSLKSVGTCFQAKAGHWVNYHTCLQVGLETESPVKSPTKRPTTAFPSKSPTKKQPTFAPTESPTESPITSFPTFVPTGRPPTQKPTYRPSIGSGVPSDGAAAKQGVTGEVLLALAVATFAVGAAIA